MQITKTNLVYFSATSTTAKISRFIADGIGCELVMRYDITSGEHENTTFANDEIVIFGAPVYAGRIPQISVKSFDKFKGNNTPAIVVCVYGNRDFDDALLELKDLVSKNGFKVISAGAFIAQHSIFPALAGGRPDANDKLLAQEFGKQSMAKLQTAKNIASISDISVKGNSPYKESKPIPFTPRVGKNCNMCGICARMCPAHAIDPENTSKTNKNICISCAHCIYVCPQKARHWGGMVYKIAARKFTEAFSARKEPYTVI